MMLFPQTDMKGITLVAILLAVIASPAVNASPADSLHAANPDTIITVDSTNLRFSAIDHHIVHFRFCVAVYLVRAFVFVSRHPPE